MNNDNLQKNNAGKDNSQEKTPEIDDVYIDFTNHTTDDVFLLDNFGGKLGTKPINNTPTVIKIETIT